MPLKMRLFPDPVLRRTCTFVRQFGPELKQTLSGMLKEMRRQPLGIGIAAPQVGIAKRIAIVDVSKRVPGAQRLYLINPEILEMKEEVSSREGCMSLPEYTGTIKRYNEIHLRWQDENGKFQTLRTTGIEARCIQHEVDHLNGLLFIDRVASLKSDIQPRKWKP